MKFHINSETQGTLFKHHFKSSIKGCRIYYELLHAVIEKPVYIYADEDEKYPVFKIDEKSGVLHTNTDGTKEG